MVGVIVVLAVVAVALLDAQSQHREQQRQQQATAFTVSLQLDSYRPRASGLRLTFTVRNDGPLAVLLREMSVGGLSGDDPVTLEPDALVVVELDGTLDCDRPVPATARLAVSLPGGDRTMEAAVPPDLDGLCVVRAEALQASAGAPEPVDDGLVVPVTLTNTGLQRLRLLAVRVRSTTATLSTLNPPTAEADLPDPARFVALPPRGAVPLTLRLATPPSCVDLARFLDAPAVVLRYDSGPGTLVASLRVPIDLTVLPDPHDVCG